VCFLIIVTTVNLLSDFGLYGAMFMTIYVLTTYFPVWQFNVVLIFTHIIAYCHIIQATK